MYIISFCPDTYFKELFPSLSQISYKNIGGTCMDHGAKAVDLETQCLNAKHTGAGVPKDWKVSFRTSKVHPLVTENVVEIHLLFTSVLRFILGG